jgi:hypothetical protein
MNSKLQKKLKTLNLSKVFMSVGVTLTTHPPCSAEVVNE